MALGPLLILGALRRARLAACFGLLVLFVFVLGAGPVCTGNAGHGG